MATIRYRATNSTHSCPVCKKTVDIMGYQVADLWTLSCSAEHAAQYEKNINVLRVEAGKPPIQDRA